MHDGCHRTSSIWRGVAGRNALNPLQTAEFCCKNFLPRRPAFRVPVSAETDEGVTERREPASDVAVAPAIGLLPPIRGLGGAAIELTSPLALASIKDDAHIGLLGELPRQVGVEVRLLTGDDEEVAHGVISSPIAGNRQRPASRRSTRSAARASRDGRRRGPPRRSGSSSSSSSSSGSSPLARWRTAVKNASPLTPTAPTRRAESRTARSEVTTTPPSR